MGDCVITTNNKVLVDNTTKLPAIQCIQYKATKKIPTEDDIVESNFNGFGNAVGSITNKVTSMYEVRACYSKADKEYDILTYRTRCGQLYQQSEIDKIKGIKAKPMPKYWYDWFATKPEENDDEKTVEWKAFQRSIVADKKPYFFRYVYPAENTKWINYNKDNNFKSVMMFGLDIEELKALKELTEEQRTFMDYYYRHLPLGIAPCIINRISWKIEEIFEKFKFSTLPSFDYNLLKNTEIEYEEKTFVQIGKIYKEYQKDRRELDKYHHNQKIDDDEYNCHWRILTDKFRRDCALVCPNKVELCNILIDVCYENSISSKRFVWEMCGDVIIENLLKRNNYIVHIPIQDEMGDFEFGGNKFSIISKKIGSKNL